MLTYQGKIRTSAAFTTFFVAMPALSAQSAEELAKLAQNPVGNLISVPFQNNINLNFEQEKKTQNVLNIQPVIPVSVSEDWNIITRTIVPVISMPSLSPGDDRTNGVGDTVFTAFLSPAKPGKIIWGGGPVMQFPTHSNPKLGNQNWGLGPAVVVLHMAKGNPWVFGALANNIWSLSDSGSGGSCNNAAIQPFVNSTSPAFISPAPRSSPPTGKLRTVSAGRFQWAAASARYSISDRYH